MGKYHPHSIRIDVQAGSDVNGVWVPGTTTSYTLDCRIEVNNSSRKYMISGDEIESNWVIMCDHFTGQDLIPAGSSIVGLVSPPGFQNRKDIKLINITPMRKHTEIEA